MLKIKWNLKPTAKKRNQCKKFQKQREMPKLNVETKSQNLNVKITTSSKAIKQNRIKAEDVL